MSQAMPSPQTATPTPPPTAPQAPVKGFSAPPVHPYRAPAPSQPATPPPATAPMSPPPTAGVSMNNGVTAQPAEPKDTPAAPAPQQQQQPQWQQPTPSATDTYVQQQWQNMMAERNQWQQQSQQQQQRIAELEKQVGQYEHARQLYEQQERLSAAINNELYDNLQTVDPEDGKKLVNATLAALAGPLNELNERIAQSQKSVESKLSEQSHMAYQQQLDQTRKAIFAAHPDYASWVNSPEYAAFLEERDGLSSETRSQRAMREFQAGNAEFIIDLFNQFKHRNTPPAAPNVVPPVESAYAYGSPVSGQQQPEPMTHTELLRLMQTHQISHDEFRKRLEELRKNQPS